MFQISCLPITDHISKIINANKIMSHDFSLPNLSYHEAYQEADNMHSYIWMCPIDDHFITSMYYYNPKFKPKKDIGLDLMDIRMSLQNVHFHRAKALATKNSTKEKRKKDKDYLDIETWRDPPVKFLNFFSKRDRSSVQRLSSVNVEVVKLYALLKNKISHKPNGFYDLVRVGLPLDNMIWWDFVLECDKGYIQIWRTPHMIEAMYDFNGDFDLVDFLEKNIKKYSKEISEIIKKLDHHTIYINHYKSYSECVKTLWEEISKIDLDTPKAPKQHLSKKREMQKYSEELPKFADNSIKYHALAKSLVLNAAFQIESYLNLLIRVGCTSELKLFPDVLNKFLRLDFSHKVKNMRFYSRILTQDIDLESATYRDAKALMVLRNKYVHFDEDSAHNKLGEILYDENYPLHPTDENRPAVESIKQMYHKPELRAVKKAYKTADSFVTYIESLMKPDLKNELIFLLSQNPIGYNEDNGRYSAVYNPLSIDFFASNSSED